VSSSMTVLFPIAMLMAGLVMGYGVLVVSGIRFTLRNFMAVCGITCLAVAAIADLGDSGGWVELLGILMLSGAALSAYREVGWQ